MTIEEVSAFLAGLESPRETVEQFNEQRIDGEAFLELTVEYLKLLVKALGDKSVRLYI